MKGDHYIKRKISIVKAMLPIGVGPCILLWFPSGFKGAKPRVLPLMSIEVPLYV